MRHDDLESRITHAAQTAAGDAPPAYLRAVTRRRWKGRAPGVAAAILVLVGGWAASLLTRGPVVGPPIPDPALAHTPPPPVPSASLAALRREGLASEGLNEVRGAYPGNASPGARAERPLRAFEVSRVLRGF